MTTKTKAHKIHDQKYHAEIAAARKMARQMVEKEDYDCLYFQQVANRLIAENMISADINLRWGGNVFSGERSYWVQIGTVYAKNTARGTNSSNRGLWAPRTSKKYCAKPGEDVLKQGLYDLRNSRPFTASAKIVLMWLDTEAMVQELNNNLRINQ